MSTEIQPHHHHHHDHHHDKHHPIPQIKRATKEQMEKAIKKYQKTGKRVLIGDLTDAEKESINQRLDALEKPKQKDGDFLNSTDWGQIIGLVLSFTPYVGSFLKVGFGIVWGKIFSKDGQYITQDQFQSSMASLYQKIETLLNEQLDASEINRCTAMFNDCQNRGNNFNDLLTLFVDRHQSKVGFIPNKNVDYRVEPPAHLLELDDDTLLQMIRSQFLDYRNFLEVIVKLSLLFFSYHISVGALINFSQPLYARILGSLYGMTMLLYSNLMRDACFQGSAWGFPPDYVYGNGDVKGLEETLHDKTQDFHYYLARCNLYYELELIKPAVSIYPAINLPDDGYKLFSQINNLDFFVYDPKNPVICIDPDSNGNFQCYDPTPPYARTVFKFDPSISKNTVNKDPHFDTVSGYNPTYLQFGSIYGPKYTIQRNGVFFYYLTVTFAIYDSRLGSEWDLYLNGRKVMTLDTTPGLNDGCVRGDRMSYYYEEWLLQYNQKRASSFITVKFDFIDYLYSVDIELRGNGGFLNGVEVTFPNYPGITKVVTSYFYEFQKLDKRQQQQQHQVWYRVKIRYKRETIELRCSLMTTKCTEHSRLHEFICYQCNKLMCSRCITTHNNDYPEHVKQYDHIDDIRQSLNNIDLNDSSKLNNENSNNNETSIWESLKSASDRYQNLTKTEDEISKHFEKFHQYLVIEEHKLKKVIISDKDIITNQIDQNINQLKYLVNFIKINNKLDDDNINSDNSSINNNNNNNNNDVEDTSDQYSAAAIIKSVSSSTSLQSFINDNSQTLFNQYHELFQMKVQLQQQNNSSDSLLLSILQKYHNHFTHTCNNNSSQMIEYQLTTKQPDLNQLSTIINQTITLSNTNIDINSINNNNSNKKHSYILSTHSGSGVTLINLSDNSTEELDTNFDFTRTYGSMITVGKDIYIFGCSSSAFKWFKFSIKSRTIEDIGEIVGVDGDYHISVCYDGQDHIYLVNGCRTNRIDRFNIKTNTFEKLYQLSDQYGQQLSSMIINGTLYSVSVKQKKLFEYSLAKNTVIDHQIDILPWSACHDNNGNFYIHSIDDKYIKYNVITKQTTNLNRIPAKDGYVFLMYHQESSESSFIYSFGGAVFRNFKYCIESDQSEPFFTDDKKRRGWCGSSSITI
ncbi:hypothetical protein PPL_03856 [Heterostelium album PN500]|uniref:B box-type domain-containing protein n=1 Tax=Heterostelium pallidum (strain ATCC 26659 / Pp 5 / PN500) TaxID=670386 RepID=D3B6U8_HETP5|nr:hypothetical protein PPL_03856 [Heterostelium album PN500]EFA83068.1 hypothetical protein PPL_03856 [Heterostelium album PN500]|eukprot:XP_020435185.1 hypothetical protein PPL_03856 [Heterostelium album PN500]